MPDCYLKVIIHPDLSATDQFEESIPWFPSDTLGTVGTHRTHCAQLVPNLRAGRAA
jgi:hypothetical protein